jgi:hypothetical protein
MLSGNNKSKRFIYKRALLTWLLFIPIAMLNGAVRQFMIEPRTGALAAHQLSVLTASVAFVVLGYFMLRKEVCGTNSKTLFVIGSAWVVMTVVFEYALGYFISGLTWREMLHNYNVFKGRFWTLLLITIAATPWLVKKLTLKNFHQKQVTNVEGQI